MKKKTSASRIQAFLSRLFSIVINHEDGIFSDKLIKRVEKCISIYPKTTNCINLPLDAIDNISNS